MKKYIYLEGVATHDVEMVMKFLFVDEKG